MTTRPIISALDSARLLPLLANTSVDAPVLWLRSLLERARVVAPAQVPPDVVTMHSRVRVQHLNEDEMEVLELTYPERPGVSVLSPLGAALLGTREGDRVQCPGSRVFRRVAIEAIEYQPEREGHLDL